MQANLADVKYCWLLSLHDFIRALKITCVCALSRWSVACMEFSAGCSGLGPFVLVKHEVICDLLCQLSPSVSQVAVAQMVLSLKGVNYTFKWSHFQNYVCPYMPFKMICLSCYCTL